MIGLLTRRPFSIFRDLLGSTNSSIKMFADVKGHLAGKSITLRFVALWNDDTVIDDRSRAKKTWECRGIPKCAQARKSNDGYLRDEGEYLTVARCGIGNSLEIDDGEGPMIAIF